jgi:peroxiredoxin
MAEMTIAGQVQDMRNEAQRQPDPRMEPFAREQAALAQTPPPEEVAKVGSVLPDAELIDVDGTTKRLSEVVRGTTAVLVLYRGAWCPYCNIALRTYGSELAPALRERGITLIAVSPQHPDGSLSMKEKNELTYEVLSDPGLVLGRAVGVLTEPSAEGLEAQRELDLDLTEVNADGTAALPMPTVVIVGPDLSIDWIDVHPDYTTRTEPEEIIAALETTS